MSNWSLGSIATEVHNLVDNIPTSISGTVLMNLAHREISFMEQFTGQSIGSVSIDIKYQGAIVDLTVAGLFEYLNAQGADFSYRLGELQVNKGGASNLSLSADKFRQMGMKKVQILGKDVKFFKAYGV